MRFIKYVSLGIFVLLMGGLTLMVLANVVVWVMDINTPSKFDALSSYYFGTLILTGFLSWIIPDS